MGERYGNAASVSSVMPTTTTSGPGGRCGPRKRNATASTRRSAAASGDGGRVESSAPAIETIRMSAMDAAALVRLGSMTAAIRNRFSTLGPRCCVPQAMFDRRPFNRSGGTGRSLIARGGKAGARQSCSHAPSAVHPRRFGYVHRITFGRADCSQAKQQAQPRQEIVARRRRREFRFAAVSVVKGPVFGHHRGKTLGDLRPALENRVKIRPMNLIRYRIERSGHGRGSWLPGQQRYLPEHLTGGDTIPYRDHIVTGNLDIQDPFAENTQEVACVTLPHHGLTRRPRLGTAFWPRAPHVPPRQTHETDRLVATAPLAANATGRRPASRYWRAGSSAPRNEARAGRMTPRCHGMPLRARKSGTRNRTT